jgi:hypothetical protein
LKKSFKFPDFLIFVAKKDDLIMNLFFFAFENQSLRLIRTRNQVYFNLPKSNLSPAHVHFMQHAEHDFSLEFVHFDKDSSLITSAFNCSETAQKFLLGNVIKDVASKTILLRPLTELEPLVKSLLYSASLVQYRNHPRCCRECGDHAIHFYLFSEAFIEFPQLIQSLLLQPFQRLPSNPREGIQLFILIK